MTSSKRSDKSTRSGKSKSPLLPNPRKHPLNAGRSPAVGKAPGPAAGRQAYTAHVAHHSRQHHKPGR